MGLYQPLACGSCREGLLELLHMGQELQNTKVGLMGDYTMREAPPRTHSGARCRFIKVFLLFGTLLQLLSNVITSKAHRKWGAFMASPTISQHR